LWIKLAQEFECADDFQINGSRIEWEAVPLCVPCRAEPALRQLLDPGLKRLDRNDGVINPPVGRLYPAVQGHLADLAPRLHIPPELGKARECKFVIRQRRRGYLVKGLEPECYAGSPLAVGGARVELASEEPRDVQRHVREVAEVCVAWDQR
jgi:hypothetical protein